MINLTPWEPKAVKKLRKKLCLDSYTLMTRFLFIYSLPFKQPSPNAKKWSILQFSKAITDLCQILTEKITTLTESREFSPWEWVNNCSTCDYCNRAPRPSSVSALILLLFYLLDSSLCRFGRWWESRGSSPRFHEQNL